MRNLKRALSLALASVMVMGMMVVGTSASYKDVDETDNLEAIEVLQAVKIMVGDDNGNFNPDANVTRNEMAVIMSNLLNLDYDYYRGINPFTDVPSWAAPYVAACAAEGVTSGIGNGLYGGSNNVTAAQAALMVLKALGYFQYAEDFGEDWTVSTIRQASYIDLFDQINANAETPLTRGQVAQMVLNGLKANMVDFTGDVGSKVNINGAEINVGYKPEYTERTNAAIKYKSIETDITNIGKDDKYYVQLGEELYNGDLKLKNDTDAFGRPARTWSYKSKEVGTYVKDELMVAEYSAKVTGKTLYELITKAVLDDSQVYIYVDGETEKTILGSAFFTKNQIAKTYDEKVGATGNGVTTQVFVDTKNDEITIAVINTYLAKAAEDYDEKNDEVDLDVYKINDEGRDQFVKTKNQKETFTVDGDDFAIADVEEDDLFLVTVADGEIQSIKDPSIVADATITNFKLEKYVTADGTKYDYADTVMYDEDVLDQYDDKNMKDVTYNIILDPYGYLIGIEQNEDPDQYVFLSGIDTNTSNLSKKNADANVIFIDGTIDTVTVNTKDSKLPTFTSTYLPSQANVWCTYTVDKNGVYTLEVVASKTDSSVKPKVKVAQAVMDADKAVDGNADNEILIDKKNVSLNGSGTVLSGGDGFTKVYGNDDTVYLNVELTNILDRNSKHVQIIDDVESVTTGVKNVNLTVKDISADGSYAAPKNEVYTLYKDNGYVIAAVVIGENDGISSNYAYITSDSVIKESYDSVEDEWTWTREAVVNGKIVELTEVGDHLKILDELVQGKWYELKYDADGNVRSSKYVYVDGDTIPSGKIIGDPKPITFDTANGAADYGTKFISEVIDVEPTVNEEDTVLLFDTTTVTKLTYKNGTLYTNVEATKGFSVSPDVKVVLCLADKSGAEFDDVDDSYTGYSGLDKAIRNLNGNFSGALSAILENGVATTIILNNDTPARNNANDAAAPIVSVDNVAVDEGETATFVATVTANPIRDYGRLTYQWYKNGVKIVGATANTLVIENVATADDGAVYKCEVTNTDTSSAVTGDTEVTDDDSGILSVTPKAPETMDIQVIYMNGTTMIAQEMRTVSRDGNKSYVTVAQDPEEADTVTALADYALKAGQFNEIVNFSANGFARVTYQVEQVKFAVSAVAGDGFSGSWVVKSVTPSKAAAGDSVVIEMEQISASDYTTIDSITFGATPDAGTLGTVSAVLTTVGDSATSVRAVITLTIDVSAISANMTITVTAK